MYKGIKVFSESSTNYHLKDIKHSPENSQSLESVLLKGHIFIFRELQLITGLFLIRDSYMSCSTKSFCLKACVGQKPWTL